LLRSCVKFAGNKLDEECVKVIPNLLFMMDETPLYISEGVEALLARSQQCEGKGVQGEVKSLSIDLWGNPRLPYAGESPWMKVSEKPWAIVAGWVAEDYMRIFFERISERHEEKKPRLAAWLKYVEWSRFIANAAHESAMLKDP